MKNIYWTTDSWGSDYAPINADEIISKANELIDQYIAENPDRDEADVQEYSNELWEAFCDSGELGGIVAEYED
jgi:hypothetical protein